MHTRILVVAKDRDIRAVFEPMLHLYGMVALPASNIETARDILALSDVHGAVLQIDVCGVAPALDFFTTLRCSARHSDTPLVLLTRDEALQDDEVLAIRAVDVRVFKYPRELDAILDFSTPPHRVDVLHDTRSRRHDVLGDVRGDGLAMVLYTAPAQVRGRPAGAVTHRFGARSERRGEHPRGDGSRARAAAAEANPLTSADRFLKPWVPDAIAVLGAQSAPDTGNQPRGSAGISRGGAPWLVQRR
jgi:hypothetical protein